MNTTETETEPKPEITQHVYKYKKPRSEATQWRYREDGKYIDRPIDPDYSRTYYYLKLREPIICDLCRCITIKKHIVRHKRSNTCIRISNEIKEKMQLEQ